MATAVHEPRRERRPDVPANPGVRVRTLQQGEDRPWHGQNRLVWVDVETPSAGQVAELARAFAFNPLALEDALQVGHWGRFEVYPEHAFLIFRTLAEPADLSERTERVSVFWYPELGSVVTIRNEPVAYVESVWHEFDRVADRQPIHVVHALLERGADTFFEFIDALEDRTDELEREVFAPLPRRRSRADRRDPVQAFATEVFELRATVIQARRLVSSAREHVAQFSRRAGAVATDEGAILLRDVADHLTRVYDRLDSERDTMTGLLDVHLNVQSNRMNEVMKTLTTLSAIFLPLTFLAGVWGMNFDGQPEFGWALGYPMAWSVFLTVGLGLAWYFKRKGWW